MRLTINNIPDGTSYVDVTDGILHTFRGRIDPGDTIPDVLTDGSYAVLTVADSESERPPLKLWQVTGHVILTRVIDGEEWTRKRPIPVFYLDEQASAISDKEEAVTIASDIILSSLAVLDSSVVLKIDVFPITYKLADRQ